MSPHTILKRILLTASFSCFLLGNLVLAGGHKIKASIANFQGSEAYLSMLYGGNQYMVDTASVSNGTFVFESFYHLQSGVYLVILPPATSFFILVDQNEHEFSFSADANDINNSLRFTGSPDNTAYYDYLNFFGSKVAFINKVKTAYDAQKEEKDKVALLSQMQQLKKEVVAHQSQIVKDHPGTLTAAMVKCEIPVELPAFEGSPESVNMQKYMYQKAHYFDHIDLADERLIRAPKNVLVDRIEYFLDYLTPQQPDSIIESVDYILHSSEKTPVSYRFLLTHIFNKYRESKSIGMDAIYVHIAENYIAAGKAPWIEETERMNVLAAVRMISPTLIGKQAPDFTVQAADGKDISLSSIESPYTVLFFWSPNCTHCQQSIPALNKFYAGYKDKGVQIFAVCTKLNEQEKNCWDYLDKNQLHSWINASDKTGGSSQVLKQYNIQNTPRIFVLDKDKTIVAKDIGVDHLEEVMKRLHL